MSSNTKLVKLLGVESPEFLPRIISGVVIATFTIAAIYFSVNNKMDDVNQQTAALLVRTKGVETKARELGAMTLENRFVVLSNVVVLQSIDRRLARIESWLDNKK